MNWKFECNLITIKLHSEFLKNILHFSYTKDNYYLFKKDNCPKLVQLKDSELVIFEITTLCMRKGERWYVETR